MYDYGEGAGDWAFEDNGNSGNTLSKMEDYLLLEINDSLAGSDEQSTLYHSLFITPDDYYCMEIEWEATVGSRGTIYGGLCNSTFREKHSSTFTKTTDEIDLGEIDLGDGSFQGTPGVWITYNNNAITVKIYSVKLYKR